LKQNPINCLFDGFMELKMQQEPATNYLSGGWGQDAVPDIPV